MVKKSKPAESPIILTPVPLDADAYYVQADLTTSEVLRLKLEWKKLTEKPGEPIKILVLPERINLKPVPSSVLHRWIDDMSGILKGRGEL